MAEARVTMTDPKKSDFYYEEAIKTLRTNIQFAGIDVKTIVFTSCYPNEGKSDVVFQLAQEMSKAGKRVLILDADIRKSNYTTRYEIKTKVVGLSQYLSGQAEATDIIYKTNYTLLELFCQ